MAEAEAQGSRRHYSAADLPSAYSCIYFDDPSIVTVGGLFVALGDTRGVSLKISLSH